MLTQEQENQIAQLLETKSIANTAQIMGVTRYAVECVNKKYNIRPMRKRELDKEKLKHIRTLYFSIEPFYSLDRIAKITRVTIDTITEKAIQPHERRCIPYHGYRQGQVKKMKKTPAPTKESAVSPNLEKAYADRQFSIFNVEKQEKNRLPFHVLLQNELRGKA